MAATIWIVDDEEAVRDVLSAMVTELGYTTRAFATGEELLAAYVPNAADIVLTDLRMPDMNGMDLLKALVQKDPHAVVIVLTGYPSIEDAVDAIKAGAADFLTKPVRMDEIKVRLKRALEGRELRNNLKKNRSLTWILIAAMPLWFILGMVFAKCL